MEIFLYVLLGVFVLVILPFLILQFIAAVIIFNILFVRKNKEKWSRNCSWENEEQQRMFDLGREWGEENTRYLKEVSIRNKKLKLVGEYFDFGFDKAVMIIAGRMETSVYCYYFAEPYKKMGYNVLAVDNRAHGLSDGKLNTIGLKEYEDVLLWAEYLHDTLRNKKIWFHGICIGAATALNAFVSKNAPDYFEGLTNEGMYKHFGSMLYKRIKERKKPIHPAYEFILLFIALCSGKSPIFSGPVYKIKKMNKPMLFMYSREDVYTEEKDVLKLFNGCRGEKKLVWFDKGIHSHIRINAQEKYDETIIDFVSKNA